MVRNITVKTSNFALSDVSYFFLLVNISEHLIRVHRVVMRFVHLNSIISKENFGKPCHVITTLS